MLKVADRSVQLIVLGAKNVQKYANFGRCLFREAVEVLEESKEYETLNAVGRAEHSVDEAPSPCSAVEGICSTVSMPLLPEVGVAAARIVVFLPNNATTYADACIRL